MKKVIIIGGGASGMACAIELKTIAPQDEVIILEQNDRVGKKILKTGNGRCNISNIDLNSEYYNHHEFVKSIIELVPKEKIESFFKKMGLLLRNDEESSRLYPYSNQATTVLEVLRYQLNHLSITVETNTEVISISKNKQYVIHTNQKDYNADIVVIATGSKAQENTKGYQILQSLGHHITSLKPGLVPIKVMENLKSIQGIRVKCQASVYNQGKFDHCEVGEVLFKDKGLSGVLTLNLSRFVREGSIISLDLFPNEDIESFLKEITKDKNIENALLGLVPKMLVYEILKRSKTHNITEIGKLLHNLQFVSIDDYGYEQAQITLGGVDIHEINNDFSSKQLNNLYIIGEVLDIDGSCGGYNLYFAWASGIIAANKISQI